VKYFATTGDETVMAERTPEGVRVGENDVEFEVWRLGPDEAHFIFADRSARMVVVRTATGWRVRLRGREYVVQLEGERARAIRELAGLEVEPQNTDLRAPMPGLVVKVLVEAGQRVAAGEGLVVVEAMKMENELRADADGVIDGVDVEPGDTVQRNQILIRFEQASS
jgi:biotin carboxyl carrier protein